MSKFNFNSQICTSREQSERLMKLGLKKETADMRYDCIGRLSDTEMIYREKPIIGPVISYYDIPAWSLHRLWCLLPHSIAIEIGRQYRAGLDLTMDCFQNVCYLEGVDVPICDMCFFAKDAYESICDAIEWLIKEGYFNKEYLA